MAIMPWKETTSMNEKERFVQLARTGIPKYVSLIVDKFPLIPDLLNPAAQSPFRPVPRLPPTLDFGARTYVFAEALAVRGKIMRYPSFSPRPDLIFPSSAVWPKPT